MAEVIQAWDLSVLTALRAVHGDLAVWSAWLLSTMAWKGILFWILAAVLWLRGYRLFAVQLALALVFATIEVAALKGTVLRPRPDLYASQQLNIPMPELLATTHSFPSGHTTLAAAAATVISLACRDWRLVATALFVVLVGVARVYQGMHWPSDCAGSVVLGVVAAALAVRLSRLPLCRRLAAEKKEKDSRPAPERTAAASGKR